MRTSFKAALGVIAVFILIGSTGLLLGGTSGGPWAEPAETPPEETESTTQSGTVTPSVTTTEVRKTKSELTEQKLNVENIESLIEKNVNNHRSSVTTLSTDTNRAAELDQLSKSHSKDMVQSRTLAHNVTSGDSEARYRSTGLYQECQFVGQGSVINAKNNRLEAIARANLDEYRGETVEDSEQNIAEGIVQDWFNNTTYRERLRREGAEDLGVGVEISENGRVYATAAVC